MREKWFFSWGRPDTKRHCKDTWLFEHWLIQHNMFDYAVMILPVLRSLWRLYTANLVLTLSTLDRNGWARCLALETTCGVIPCLADQFSGWNMDLPFMMITPVWFCAFGVKWTKCKWQGLLFWLGFAFLFWLAINCTLRATVSNQGGELRGKWERTGEVITRSEFERNDSR